MVLIAGASLALFAYLCSQAGIDWGLEICRMDLDMTTTMQRME